MCPSLNAAGKPHIFLLDDADREKARFKTCEKNPDALADVFLVIDASYRIVNEKHMTPPAIEALRTGFLSRFTASWEVAGRRLVQFSHYFDQASRLLMEMTNHQKANIRLRVVQSLFTDRPPDTLTRAILVASLQDSSSQVRRFAADRVLIFEMRDLLSNLGPLLNDANQKVRDTATLTQHLLTDGFFLRPGRTGEHYQLTIYSRHGIGGPLVPKNECSPENIRRLTQEYHAHLEEIHGSG